jgi:hypothetical protein
MQRQDDEARTRPQDRWMAGEPDARAADRVHDAC